MAKTRVCALLVFLFAAMFLLAEAGSVDAADIEKIPWQKTGRDPKPGQIINSLGVDASNLKGCLYLLSAPMPWEEIFSQRVVHKLKQYINLSDGIVLAVARNVYVAKGIGLCDSKTGARLEIARINDIDVWGCDYYQPAGWTLWCNGGDCEDRAIAFYHLLRLRGLQAAIVFYCRNEPSDRDVDTRKRNWHVLVQYKLGGKAYISDFGRDTERDPEKDYEFDGQRYTPCSILNEDGWNYYRPDW